MHHERHIAAVEQPELATDKKAAASLSQKHEADVVRTVTQAMHAHTHELR